MLAIVMGGGGVDAKSFTLSCVGGGGAQRVSDPQFFHFLASRLPVINDQSLYRQAKMLAVHKGQDNLICVL